MVMYTLVLHDTTRPNHRTMSTDVLNTCRQREMGVCSKGSTLKKVLQEKWEGREGGEAYPSAVMRYTSIIKYRFLSNWTGSSKRV